MFLFLVTMFIFLLLQKKNILTENDQAFRSSFTSSFKRSCCGSRDTLLDARVEAYKRRRSRNAGSDNTEKHRKWKAQVLRVVQITSTSQRTGKYLICLYHENVLNFLSFIRIKNVINFTDSSSRKREDRKS